MIFELIRLTNSKSFRSHSICKCAMQIFFLDSWILLTPRGIYLGAGIFLAANYWSFCRRPRSIEGHLNTLLDFFFLIWSSCIAIFLTGLLPVIRTGNLLSSPDWKSRISSMLLVRSFISADDDNSNFIVFTAFFPELFNHQHGTSGKLFLNWKHKRWQVGTLAIVLCSGLSKGASEDG